MGRTLDTTLGAAEESAAIVPWLECGASRERFHTTMCRGLRIAPRTSLPESLPGNKFSLCQLWGHEDGMSATCSCMRLTLPNGVTTVAPDPKSVREVMRGVLAEHADAGTAGCLRCGTHATLQAACLMPAVIWAHENGVPLNEMQYDPQAVVPGTNVKGAWMPKSQPKPPES